MDYSKHISPRVHSFVERALPYSHWGMNYFNIRLMELTLIDSLLDAPIKQGGERFLDVGCGIGLASVYVSEFFTMVDGTDIDEIGVAFNVDRPAPLVGSQILTDLGLANISLHCGETLSFLVERQEYYDMILSIFVLEHIEDIDEITKSMTRSLRPGGRIVNIVPNTHDTMTQLLLQNLQPVAHNNSNMVSEGRGLRKLGSLYVPITHSEFIDDYREQFEINTLERYLFPMLANGLNVQKISPIRERSFGILATLPESS